MHPIPDSELALPYISTCGVFVSVIANAILKPDKNSQSIAKYGTRVHNASLRYIYI
jgi:hypothetical protein